MLDKRNQKLYKSLRGEYRKYARQLKNTLFNCCQGSDAVNESLTDVFSMLAEAQGEGRPFEEIIPDPAASIRETALCFPARRTRLHTVVILILAALLVIVAGTAVGLELTRPIRLDVPSPQFDAANFTVYWQPVEHATEYEVSVNSTFLGSTEGTAYALDEDDYANMDELHITVTARAGGRYLGGSGTTVYQRTMPSVRRVLTLEELFPNEYNSEFTFPAGVYESIVLQLRPEINLCVKFYGPSLRALRRGSIYSDERDWGEPMDTDSYLILNAGVSYVIEIEPDDYDPTVGFTIELINLLSYAKSYYPYLPQGITLFAKDGGGVDPSHGLPDVSYDPDWNTAFTAEGFRFAYVNSLEHVDSLTQYDQAIWMDSFVMDHTDAGYLRTAFWLVHNTQDESAHFSAKKRIETVSVPDSASDPVTVSAAPGWTTYNFLVENRLGIHPLPADYFLLYNHGDSGLFFSGGGSGHSWPLELSSTDSGIPQLEIYDLNLSLYESNPATVTISVYNPNDEAVEFTCDKLHSTTLLINIQGTIKLQPGLTFFLNDTDWLLRVQSESWFFADEYPILRLPATMPLTQSFAFQEWAYFFNPYDEPIELTLTPYTPI